MSNDEDMDTVEAYNDIQVGFYEWFIPPMPAFLICHQCGLEYPCDYGLVARYIVKVYCIRCGITNVVLALPCDQNKLPFWG